MNSRYRDPGIGAIEFAKQFIEGMTMEEARPIVKQLLQGKLHDTDNKRIKGCDYCGYWWCDDSYRNTKRSCSVECKKNIKTMQRRKQRAAKELLNPKPRKHTLMDDYLWWYEYPFWINEYSMIKIGWKYERPHGLGVMNAIEAKREIYGPGNRKIPKRVVDYHGDKRDEF
ncbi:hypothetical protein P9858_00810 [Niallia circulans]|uniref:hypothetical protein n=1 Tax=Niallia circulans TaxID=1397 RepID=UPI002E1E49F1|nr:hypothetical protein [Niallia circulans]